MSFGDSIVSGIGGDLVNAATGQISSRLANVTSGFSGIIGNVTGSINGAVGGVLGNVSGAINSLTGGLLQDVQALFFRGQVVAIGDLAPDCTLQEDLSDTVTVTDHPVEVGAAITDHAFLNPCEATLHLGWTSSKGFLSSFLGASSPSPTEAYETLRQLMAARDPLDVLTTLRAYSDMLIVGISVRRDDKTANILDVTVKLRQVILVSTSTTQLKAEAQAVPDQTLSIENVGTKLATKVKESALSSIAGLFH